MPFATSWKSVLALASLSPLIACQQQVYYAPGQFSVYAADAPFAELVTQAPLPGTKFSLRPSDGLLSADGTPLTGTYGANANYAGVRPGPCSPYEACQVIFQTDGNLVQYYNGAAVWQSGTSGRGVSLALSAHIIYAWIEDAAGNMIWKSNPETSPGGGRPCFAYNGQGECVSY